MKGSNGRIGADLDSTLIAGTRNYATQQKITIQADKNSSISSEASPQPLPSPAFPLPNLLPQTVEIVIIRIFDNSRIAMMIRTISPTTIHTMPTSIRRNSATVRIWAVKNSVDVAAFTVVHLAVYAVAETHISRGIPTLGAGWCNRELSASASSAEGNGRAYRVNRLRWHTNLPRGGLMGSRTYSRAIRSRR